MNIVKKPISYRTSNNDLIVWWETDSQNTVGHGALVTISGQPEYSVVASSDLVTDSANQPHAVHTIYLRQLPPDSLVAIQVTGPNFKATTPVSFRTTAPGTDYTFGILNSPEGFFGSSSPELGYALDRLGEVDFYLSCGGICGQLSSYESWTDWYNTVVDSVGRAGMLVAKSSLDYSLPMAARMLPTDFGEQKYFAASVGSVRVVSLDTSMSGRRGLVSNQRDWALNEFNSAAWKDADFRIVLISDPFRVNYWDQSKSFGQGTGTDKFLMTNLYPLLQQSGADLVIAGRVHSYQRGAFSSTYPEHDGQIIHYVACGGIAPAHRTNAWDWPISAPPGIIVSTSDYHCVKLSIRSSVMEVACYQMDTGDLLDSFEIPAHTLY